MLSRCVAAVNGLQLLLTVLILAFPCVTTSSLNTLILTEGSTPIHVGEYAFIAEIPREILESDGSTRDTFEQYIEPSFRTNRHIEWTRNHQEKIIHDFDDDVASFYFEVINQNSQVNEYLLELNGGLAFGWAYRDAEGELVLHADWESASRPVFDTAPVASLQLIPGHRYQVFVSVLGIEPKAEIRAKIYTPDEFRQSRIKKSTTDGAYLGLMMALILYNLFLFVAIRQIAYLYYSAFQFCITGIVWSATGYTGLLITQDFNEYWFSIVAALMGSQIVFRALFAVSLLKLKTDHPKLYIYWMAIVVSALIGTIILTAAAWPIGGELSSNFGLVSNLFALFIVTWLTFEVLINIVTIVRCWSDSIIARYWFLAFSFYTIALLLIVFLIGINTIALFESVYLWQLVTLLDALLLSLVLAYRSKLELEQRSFAQQSALQSLRRVQDVETNSSRFVSRVGHDLRQPLQAINLLLVSLRKTTPNQSIHFIEQIESNLNEVSKLLSDLIDLARARSGKLKSSETVDPSKLLKTIVTSFQPIAEAKGISLVLQEVEPNIQLTNCNQAALQQILRNLIDNAIKYTNHGSVTITTDVNTSNMTIEICDTGIGIAESEVSQIFDEFYRSEATSTLHAGFGIGLAIVDSLAKESGVEIDFDSKPGQGTTVTVQINIDSAEY